MRRFALAFAAALILGSTGCGGGGGVATPAPQPPSIQLGDPLPGLSAAELAAFERGRAQFTRRFRPSEGLGPFYNATACSSCHSTPVTGGSGRLYRNFYLAVWGPVDAAQPLPPGLSPIVPAYGTGPAHATATFSLTGGRTCIPDTWLGSPVRMAQRNAIPVFGTGLFEAVSDATIVGNADPNDADGDGISGRYNRDTDGTIGRLGVKAQSHDVVRFTRGPLMNQMGITSDPLSAGSAKDAAHEMPRQVSTDPGAPLTDGDGVADPEIAPQDLADLVAFSRFLAPPQPLAFDAAAKNGETLFDQIGCTKCHFPSLPSSRGDVHAYTDLLLHDMGDDLADGISFGDPQPSTIAGSTTEREWRTQPLWGVRLHGPWLHDGRAGSLREAVEMHAGEAAAIRDAFLALTPGEQADLLSFLEHL